MSSPDIGGGAPNPKRVAPAIDRRALQPYLAVQKASDRQILLILRDALKDVNKHLAVLSGKTNIGSLIRADQFAASKSAILRSMADIWRKTGNEVRAARYDAASAAADSVSIYDKMVKDAVGPAKYAELMAGLKADAKHAVDLGGTRLTTSAIELSNNVYHAQALSTGQLERLLNAMLARGTTAREIAKAVRGFINPNTPGGVSYAAMRLGRTELNNAFHAQQAAIMASEPWVQATQWNLSGSHPKPDECDDYASNTSFNGRPGEYEANSVPGNPHPQCLCFLTPVTLDNDTFLERLNNGDYDNWVARYT